jgi:hypothetical protein
MVDWLGGGEVQSLKLNHFSCSSSGRRLRSGGQERKSVGQKQRYNYGRVVSFSPIVRAYVGGVDMNAL